MILVSKNFCREYNGKIGLALYDAYFADAVVCFYNALSGHWEVYTVTCFVV